jgi:hypothetical protein
MQAQVIQLPGWMCGGGGGQAGANMYEAQLRHRSEEQRNRIAAAGVENQRYSDEANRQQRAYEFAAGQQPSERDQWQSQQQVQNALAIHQGQLSMAEQLEMQRQEGGLAEIDAAKQRGEIDDKDHAQLQSLVRQRLQPYQARAALTQQRQQDAQLQQTLTENKVRTVIANQNLEAANGALQMPRTFYTSQAMTDAADDVATNKPDVPRTLPNGQPNPAFNQLVQARLAALPGTDHVLGYGHTVLSAHGPPQQQIEFGPGAGTAHDRARVAAGGPGDGGTGGGGAGTGSSTGTGTGSGGRAPLQHHVDNVLRDLQAHPESLPHIPAFTLPSGVNPGTPAARQARQQWIDDHVVEEAKMRQGAATGASRPASTGEPPPSANESLDNIDARLGEIPEIAALRNARTPQEQQTALDALSLQHRDWLDALHHGRRLSGLRRRLPAEEEELNSHRRRLRSVPARTTTTNAAGQSVPIRAQERPAPRGVLGDIGRGAGILRNAFGDFFSREGFEGLRE